MRRKKDEKKKEKGKKKLDLKPWRNSVFCRLYWREHSEKYFPIKLFFIKKCLALFKTVNTAFGNFCF